MSGQKIDKTLVEMERIRNELYKAVDGNWQMLSAEKTWQISSQLDKLIIRYMGKSMKSKTS